MSTTETSMNVIEKSSIFISDLIWPRLAIEIIREKPNEKPAINELFEFSSLQAPNKPIKIKNIVPN